MGNRFYLLLTLFILVICMPRAIQAKDVKPFPVLQHKGSCKNKKHKSSSSSSTSSPLGFGYTTDSTQQFIVSMTTTANTWIPIRLNVKNLALWNSLHSGGGFTSDGLGSLTYTGSKTKTFVVKASLIGTSSSSTIIQQFGIAINGAAPTTEQIIAAGAAASTNFIGEVILTLNPGDAITPHFYSLSSLTFTPYFLSMRVYEWNKYN